MNNFNVTKRRHRFVIIPNLKGNIRIGKANAEVHNILRFFVEKGEKRILLNLADVSLVCVHYLKVFLFTFINFVLLAGLMCLVAPSVNAQSSVGVKTDLGVYPEGPVPTLPAAGGKLTDPTFGTQIMRVTDEMDGTDLGTTYSYWSTFNSNNTRLLVQSYNGTAYLYLFDPTQFKLGAKQEMIFPPGIGDTTAEDAVWSAVDPDVLFIHRGAVLYAFNARTRSYSTVADLSSQYPAGSYLWQMSISRDDNVFAFTIKNPDDSDGGYAVWQYSTNRVIYSVRVSELDEVQTDKTGRYLIVKTGNQGRGIIEVKVVDLQTQAVTDLIDDEPDFAPGHSDNGRGTVIGADNWQNRLTYRNLATPHDLRTVLSFGNDWGTIFHVSALGDNEDWVLVSFYGTTTSGIFNRELVLVATDGSQRVKRLAHHYSMWANNYYDSPRANISRDGRFIAFTSNWGGSNRRDLFIAQIPTEALTTPSPSPSSSPPPASTPSPTPTAVPTATPITSPSLTPTPTPPPATPTPSASPSTANAVFENVIGFNITGGNRLDKLSTPYWASADTAGVVTTDGRFSYKYNTINNGRGVSVWLDDGTHTFMVVNQGSYSEVRVDGVYKTAFSLDITKTIAIERVGGGVIKVWEDNTLRYQSAPGASNGAADFKIQCGGELLGLGINNAMITGLDSPSPTATPTVTPITSPSPTPTPMPIPSPSAVNAVFENVIGFNITGGNRLDKQLLLPYWVTADTAGVVTTDGRFSYKYNTINNGRGVSVWLDDGTHTFMVVNQGSYSEVRVDGVYKTAFSLDITKTIAIERVGGGVIKVWEDNTLRYQSAPGASNGAADFKIQCGGDSTAVGLGINSAMITNPTSSPPPPSTANAVFENVIGFDTSGGNRLDKLSTPYWASADTAGAVNTDGRFSYKYNTINNGRGVSVWLDDGTHTFMVVNQGSYLEVRVDGMYEANFPRDITKTIAIERIGGGVIKVWEDNTLRYQSAPGASNGAADFKIQCGGELLGLGINNAMITGLTGN